MMGQSTLDANPLGHLFAALGTPVRELVADSRLAQPGTVFVACPGTRQDGRAHIAEAVSRGVDGVLWDTAGGFAWNPDWACPNVGVPHLRARLGEIAHEVYGRPSAQMAVVGVTGTNGKTSVSHWVAQALTTAGRRAALAGTVGNGFPGRLAPATHTTPDAIALQKLLAAFVREGATACAMEVSSHALDQGRVHGVRFEAAVLTQLSRDHLDYHGSMEAYAAAKARLFAMPGLGTAVLNLEDALGQSLLHTHQAGRTVTYGFHSGDLHLAGLVHTPHGLRLEVTGTYGRGVIQAPVLGRFNAANLLAALGALIALDLPLADACAALGTVSPPPGRMQMIGGGAQPRVVVDYAHTPDALDTVLATLRESCSGRLLCVMGCGGNRDAGKRPLMGAAAARRADVVWITSDNPRDEDPQAIIAAIVEGARSVKGARLHTEPDRARAIFEAIGAAGAGDTVLIAGKGHETWQEIAGERLPFSDPDVARKALEAWR